MEDQNMWKAECTKATCRHVEYYHKHPGRVRCPKCGAIMVVRRA